MNKYILKFTWNLFFVLKVRISNKIINNYSLLFLSLNKLSVILSLKEFEEFKMTFSITLLANLLLLKETN
jgi:hypothetical protein